MACVMMEAKIMKYHVFSGYVAEIWQKIKIELSFLTDILLPEQVKMNQKASSYCSPICTLLSYIGLAHLLFASFPTSFEKARKMDTPSTHDLVVGF